LKPELSIIAAFLQYDVWEKHNGDVQVSDIPDDLQPIYRCLDAWHKTQEESITVLDLATYFFSSNKTNKEFYEGIFDNLSRVEPNMSAVREYINSLKRQRQLRELSIKAYEVAEGKKSYEDIQSLIQALGEETEESEEEPAPFVTDGLQVLLDNTYRTPGYRWRLKALNESLGSLRKGDFGFIFARPETGKTTFLASEITCFASQLKEDETVLWINNEEVNEKVKTRVYQAALGVTLEELLANPDKHEAAYIAKFGGKILIPRQSSYSRWDIEKLCKRVKPRLIVIDQIDKITGFKADREDLELGAIYQWARELAKQYGPVIAVCQADGTGENKKWLTMGNVANAKTSKQAEADWIVGIGFIHDTGWEKVRFLHISKNKLAGDPDSDPNKRHGKMEVLIQPEVARYRDL
jgi:KaiC/GvpD/RAD55 family RecA-like ATPase